MVYCFEPLESAIVFLEHGEEGVGSENGSAVWTPGELVQQVLGFRDWLIVRVFFPFRFAGHVVEPDDPVFASADVSPCHFGYVLDYALSDVGGEPGRQIVCSWVWDWCPCDPASVASLPRVVHVGARLDVWCVFASV
jgi:hypothetical protein